MADTITITGNIIQIVPNAAGLSNFNIATYFPGEVQVIGIALLSANAADLIKVRETAATGAFIAPKVLAGGTIGFNPPLYCRPYILATDCTLTDPANCIITIYLR